MTPRQIVALTMIADEQDRQEKAEALFLGALAAQGSEDALKKTHRDLLGS